MKKAILFDMDGLMLETKLTWQEAEKGLLSSFGKTYNKEIAKKYQGMRVPGVVSVMIKEYQLPISEQQGVEALTQRIVDNYQHPDLELLPGCEQLVKELHISRIYLLAIASSSPKPAIEAMVKRFHFEGIFDQLISGDELKEGKPAPDIFLKCAKRLSVSPSDCLVFEDAPKGIEAAKRAGMKAIAVCNPFFYSPEDFRDHKADLIATSLEDVNLQKLEEILSS